MLAIIFDSIDSSYQKILKDGIKLKYPSIEFEVLDRASIINNSLPETIIFVMNEEALNSKFVEFVQTTFPDLEHFICLVSSEKYEEYYSQYSSDCMIIKQNKKDIRMLFENIDGEIKVTEELSLDNLDDIGLDDLDFEEEGVEERICQEIDNSLDAPPSLELPDNDDLPEANSLGGEDEETFNSEFLIETDASSVNEQMEGKELDELPLSMDKDNSSKPEEPITEVESKEIKPVPNEEIIQSASEEIKERKVQQKKYEEKIISLREGLDIPVWRKRQIQSKTIGIWSPLHRIGVTTLTINLALYLASLSIPVGVIEGITKNLKMKSLLEIYSKRKSNWISYNTYLEEEHHKAKDTMWSYEDVNFFPFEEHDLASKWNEQKIYYFMNGLKFHDIVFVDFPTGEMAPYTLESLQYVDELWVVMNNDLLSMMEWKDYIHQTIKPKVSVHGFFIDAYPFSKPKKLVEQMELHYISSLPALHEEVAQNYYGSVPLLNHEGVYEKVEKELFFVLEHFTGKKQKKVMSTEKDHSIFKRFTKRMQRR
ncbi:hypothetical protein [Virgibacillus halodenitrificans]|uniref:hypothetical protein n=1 Tax=Virgibacillus halodenitrificans TaxID=1482 RepID=UPI000EF4B57B|nr:hypothetical protein [Virgibacillus halodenitrificans]